MLRFYYAANSYPTVKDAHCVGVAKFLLGKAISGIDLRYYTSSPNLVRTLHAIICSDYRIQKYVSINIEGKDVDFNYFVRGLLDQMKMDRMLGTSVAMCTSSSSTTTLIKV